MAVFLAMTNSSLAMEPPPSNANGVSAGDQTGTRAPASARIIVKYVDQEAGRVLNEAAAQQAAVLLSEVAGVEIRHVRLMSGNAQVVEVVGLDTQPVATMIDAIVERIEADQAVEYAEVDAIMRIQ